MKNIKSIIITIAISTIAYCSYSQGYDDIYYSPHKNKTSKIKSKEIIDKINVVSNYNIKFNYDSTFIDWKFSEEDYLLITKNKKNEKVAGSGDLWLEEWHNVRKKKFEPLFINKLNEEFSGYDKVISIDTTAQITIEVEVINIIIGWNVGIAKLNSELFYKVRFFDKENNIITETKQYRVLSEKLSFFINGISISGYSEFTRLAGCYEAAAEKLADYMKRNIIR